MLFGCSAIFFNLIATVPQWEWPPLSPQAELDLPSHTTALPTSMGSGGFILKISFNFLHIFLRMLFGCSTFFSIK
jgi:hypothetical protein